LRRNKVRMFKIPISYEVCGEVLIEARTVEEALKYANENIEELELPSIYDVEYIDGSFKINDDMALIDALNTEGEIRY